jgi:prepilin-type N-terminal cleavage/methylation domain-containing protein
MKTTRIIRSLRSLGFTLIELLVVIAIIAILAGFALPVFSNAQKRGRLTDQLSNAKQVNLALKMYAGDNGGAFPATKTDGSTALASADKSNDAFNNLIPKYSSSKKIFLNKSSAWCKTPAADTTATYNVLGSMQNDFAYVLGLVETSDARFPLIFNSPAATAIKYTSDTAAKGGVWGGTDAIIGLADGSARLFSGSDMDVSAPSATFPKNPNVPGSSYFDSGVTGWLTSSNTILYPQP